MLLLSCSSAEAFVIPPDFEPFAIMKTGETLYFHPDSIRKRNGITYVWVIDPSKATIRGKHYASSKYQFAIKCKTEEWTATYAMHFDKNDTLLFTEKSNQKEWLPIPPHSIMGTLKDIVCKK